MKKRSTIKYELDYDALIKTVKDIIDPQLIILFGSRARNDYEDMSDYDLVIVDKERFTKERSRFVVRKSLRLAVDKLHVPIDLLLFSKEEFDEWHDYPNHILYECVQEGKVLYEES